jgi:hypothetical protein
MRAPARWPIALLAFGLACLYFLLPERLGPEGGFVRARVVVIVPLLAVACLPTPGCGRFGWSFQCTLFALIGLNLILVSRYFASANRELAEFVTGVDYAGHERTLAFSQPNSTRKLVNWWEHAGNYYCLTTRNIDLYNYEAELRYFPLRFRADVRDRWRGNLPADGERLRPEIILIWDPEPALPVALSPVYHEVFRHGRLGIFEIGGSEEARLGHR